MRTIILLAITHCFFSQVIAQGVINMEQQNSYYVIPCKVNGLNMKFAFNTTEMGATISITDVIFMIKNGYLKTSELSGVDYEKLLRGSTSDGTKVILKSVEVGGLILTNVAATIVPNLSTPLLLGQEVLSQIGKIEFDYFNATVAFNGKNVNKIIPQPVHYTQTSISNGRPSKASKFLVITDAKLFSQPIESQNFVKVSGNSIVHLIDRDTANENFWYVDYLGYKGYISRYALEQNESEGEFVTGKETP